MVKNIIKLLLCSICCNSYAGCIINVSNLNFGTYQSPYQYSDILSSGNINLSCDSSSNGNSVGIKLSSGQSENFDRYLTNGHDKLNYNLYLDNNRSVIFGDGSNGTSMYNGTLSSNNNINIFAKVPKNQNVSPGNYQDNIIFEVTF